MRAAWYDRPGPAADVLVVGELPEPHVGPGEVRVRVHMSGINPGDTKKRLDAFGYGMAAPRIIPHSDGAGVVDEVGAGVTGLAVGQRVWVWGAQSYRAFGTAAEYVVVPQALAVALPDQCSFEEGACLGIPGITAHRCLFADGSVRDRQVLVQGVLGSVGRFAAQLARWDGARVVGAVRRTADLDEARTVVADVVALDDSPAEALRSLAPDGVDRIVEVAMAANAALDSEVAANGAVIAAYATNRDPVPIPFWELLFRNVTLRTVGSDDIPADARAQALDDLGRCLADGALVPAIAEVLPLERCAEAHDLVDAGTRGRVLLSLV